MPADEHPAAKNERITNTRIFRFAVLLYTLAIPQALFVYSCCACTVSAIRGRPPQTVRKIKSFGQSGGAYEW
jgi:hypothetical protein